MKIIALLPFKNEERFIPTYVSGVLHLVDAVIAIDDGSTDNSVELLKNLCGDKVTIVANDSLTSVAWKEHHIREKLLELGRQAGGTHFVCLDADETFTGTTKTKFKKLCESMSRGQKLSMQWLANWKSYSHYRDDSSVWSNNFKDFVVCDYPGISYDYVWLHVGRTPGGNTSETLLRVNPKYAAVHHFQFSDFSSFQIKQAYWRCSELITLGESQLQNINNKYRITLDDENAFVRECPPEWMEGLVLPRYQVTKPINLKLEAIREYFNVHGVLMFEGLDIWHIPELQKEFFDRTGRNPQK